MAFVLPIPQKLPGQGSNGQHPGAISNVHRWPELFGNPEVFGELAIRQIGWPDDHIIQTGMPKRVAAFGSLGSIAKMEEDAIAGAVQGYAQ